MKILILQGPNLNLLGSREPDIYGSESLESLERNLREWAAEQSIELEFFQSNREAELLESLHSAKDNFEGIVFNPGAFTHSSIALRDAIAAISIPVVEVHLSEIQGRESWRRSSVTAQACSGMISGMGARGYRLAVLALKGP
ncbi:MAG: type II 3-dehydroquinate dehydratase [Candidatus Krumholzibacteria bacterium]|jgi:3-dehydroquinate dehydratase-2|nr:type II 3-dehydroquinate dehydratase [Candidatus Krumholzibacteria bacterium]MDP6669590.1 type II 3-dehydroquinate dehydratase [Candidatus Krumholzibacteria bacterium]MDP6797275.1 type II 3-dehydroquinate dehydratase [Candidatus Krumholzibacteria bacterium]MDP7020791.1 type II 3-dehydroquinate dehydratase [Candidatus Krumholzibacteria bacterium]